jgi:hypothetical protein
LQKVSLREEPREIPIQSDFYRFQAFRDKVEDGLPLGWSRHDHAEVFISRTRIITLDLDTVSHYQSQNTQNRISMMDLDISCGVLLLEVWLVLVRSRTISGQGLSWS